MNTLQVVNIFRWVTQQVRIKPQQPLVDQLDSLVSWELYGAVEQSVTIEIERLLDDNARDLVYDQLQEACSNVRPQQNDDDDDDEG